MRRDIAVVGGGLAGFGAALGLAAKGFDTALIAPPPPPDRRTTALIGSSVDFLKDIGVWNDIARTAQPLRAIRIIDDTRRLFRAPPLEFRAAEIDLPDFGMNAANIDILAAMRNAAGLFGSKLTILEAPLADLETNGEAARLRLADGTDLRADLAIGADGRRSRVRECAGIGSRTWSYRQTALVLSFGHRRNHEAVSTEFHTRSGPFTQVPLPGRRSSLVWVEDPDRAQLLADLPAPRLSSLVEERMHSILGEVEVEPGVQAFPLSGSNATQMTAPRVALVGEAAHVFPPIGAQGLNLGLRDAAAIVEAADRFRDDPGSAAALAHFSGRRRADVATRTAAVDLLNRSLLADFLPIQIGRTVALNALSAVPTLRRFAMREGLAPGSGWRSLSGSLARRAERVRRPAGGD